MGRMIYIPPDKTKVKVRTQAQPQPISPDEIMNHVRFINLLKGTPEEIYIGLVKRFMQNFHGNLAQWHEKLDELKNQPA